MYENRWYVGVPKSGKTTLALEHALAGAARDRNPVIFVDSNRSWNFGKIHHAQSVQELIVRVWDHGLHTAITPSALPYCKNGHLMYFEQVCAAVKAMRNVHLLVDEAYHYLSARSVSGRFSDVMRSLQHCRANTYITTQHHGDLARECLANADAMYVFRTTELSSLDRLAKQGLDPEELKNLPRGAHRELRFGFSN